jgi:hypothetical protein
LGRVYNPGGLRWLKVDLGGSRWTKVDQLNSGGLRVQERTKQQNMSPSRDIKAVAAFRGIGFTLRRKIVSIRMELQLAMVTKVLERSLSQLRTWWLDAVNADLS